MAPPAVDGGFYHVAVPNAFSLCAGHVLRSGSLPGVGGGKRRGYLGDTDAFCYGYALSAACQSNLLHSALHLDFPALVYCLCHFYLCGGSLYGGALFSQLGVDCLLGAGNACRGAVLSGFRQLGALPGAQRGEALQTMGYLLLPLLLLYLIQFTGVFRVTAPLLMLLR